MSDISTSNLIDACSVLFGSNVEVSQHFLNYLQPSGLKAAYRQRAFETHPDRTNVLGEVEDSRNERFKEVVSAYEILSSVIQDKDSLCLVQEPVIQKRCSKPSPSVKTPRRTLGERYFNGNIPKRELMIGQYLYYSSLVSWQAFIKAIVWQRKNHRLIGQIALEKDLISAFDVYNILKQRKMKEKFGDCAVRRGYLTPFQRLALLGKQRKLHHPIGEYFIRKGLFTHLDMARLVVRQQIHNKNT